VTLPEVADNFAHCILQDIIKFNQHVVVVIRERWRVELLTVETATSIFGQ